MPKRTQEKQLSDLLKKAAFADKVLKLAVKAGLTEPVPLGMRRVKVRVPEAPTVAPALQPRVVPPSSSLVKCTGCNSLIPEDAFETHAENCTEARGVAYRE